jgi:3-oxoadipate enol-lactonase
LTADMIAQSNGTAIRYEISGPALAPAIVLSHSLGVNLEMWHPQVEALSERYRVVRYDIRGHGDSAVAAGPYSIEMLGKDVLGLLDFLGIEQVHFCGLSLGGVIGQWLGIHAPRRLQRLVLASTAAKIGTTESWNTRIATVEKDGLDTVMPGTLQRWFTEAFRKQNVETVRWIEGMLKKTKPAGYVACCAAIRDADFRSAANTISAPTLLIAGEKDPVTTCEDLRYLADEISQATYIACDAAHLSNVEAQDDFNRALLAFLL